MKALIDATPKNGVFKAKPVTAYLPVDVLKNRLRTLDPENDYPAGGRQGPFVKFQPLAPHRAIVLAGCKVTPLETNHLHPDGGPGADCFGYLFEDADGTRMAYMVDAQADLPEATAEALLAKRLDCLIWECTFEKLDRPIGHTDIADLIALKGRFSPRTMVATHVSHQNLGHRELVELLRPQRIRVAHDGMRIQVRPRRIK